jgi:hypothetical protein
MNAYEILKKYAKGELSIADSNAALAEIDAGVYLDPEKNVLTEDEIRNGTAGLLDTGTGFFDKVQVIRGELVHPANEVSADGTVNMPCFVLLQGKLYRVEGTKLFEI